MEAVFLGASVGAILAYGLLSQSKRRMLESEARQREAELFGRRLRMAAKS